MQRVLIAGCGYVGTALGLFLHAQGAQVYAIRRDVSGLPEPLHPVACDLGVPLTLDHLPREWDAVVYCAAAGEFSPAAYRRAYVDGLRHLIEAAGAAGWRVGRWLFTSSTSVYAQSDGAWVDETSETNPASETTRQLLDAEALLTELPGTTIIARLAGIYGPGRERLIDQIRTGQATPSMPGTYSNRIYLEDIVGALSHLLLQRAPAPIYNICDNEPTPLGEIYDWLAGRLGVSLAPQEGAAPHKSTDASSRRSQRSMRSNKRCANTRLRESGYQLHYPTFREGFDALIAMNERKV